MSNYDKWNECLNAAVRKINIAKHHHDQLVFTLEEREVFHSENTPSIAIQAQFEGVVLSAIAAIDQLCQAVNTACGLGAKPCNLFEKASCKIIELIPDFADWKNDPFGVDLRQIRTRMVHYSYEKTPDGPTWCVEKAHRSYPGKRDLLSYSTAACGYVNQLLPFIPKLKEKLPTTE